MYILLLGTLIALMTFVSELLWFEALGYASRFWTFTWAGSAAALGRLRDLLDEMNRSELSAQGGCAAEDRDAQHRVTAILLLTWPDVLRR